MAAVPEQLTLSQARRATLRAHGLAGPRPARAVTGRAVDAVVDRLGVLQIDSVNVLARAHLVPLWSRLGAYDPALLDRAAGRAPRWLVEAWAHQASYVPVTTFPLLGWRRRAYRTQAWGSIRSVPLQLSAELADVRAVVAERGPLTAREVHDLLGAQPLAARTDWGWNWTAAKRVLEFLFFTGEVAAASRTASFERRYDLTERVLPPHVRDAPEPAEADAVRALVAVAARAQGVASLRCLADHFRLRQDQVRPAVADLVDAGELVPVRVEGWDTAVVRHRDATVPRRAAGATLLSPFDPVVFERRRVETLFGLRYRIEIYVPEPLRTWGYYVLPFLLGEHVVALVDLKADRGAGVLRVLAAHTAPVVGPAAADRRAPRPGPGEVAHALAAELVAVAGWLGLGEVEVGDRSSGEHRLVGDLAPVLATALVGRSAASPTMGAASAVHVPAGGRQDGDAAAPGAPAPGTPEPGE
ncbi:winged helix-turn-helix domain-containing protein [Cellulomonas marina]|uniref:Winged helix-turn-helix domain-containing protein n=1 Tax=Cellulomonas marina TaxID=988821 RepID=A0A1I0V087_9CELL|nr:crosslink repair DNA glycosylase YcaQ family protein [Cellulomonas marina]GIG28237.1 hypothetical protein Cma02nite_08370 [Cellulomonas marina]SFA69764.1 hypothetical protein SAMN05421867_10164 [Cellulomonas marina]